MFEDYLHDQRFVPSVANPASRRRGEPRQPLLIPPQPGLSMKGRTPEALLRAVEDWHRHLGSIRAPVAGWRPTGIAPLAHEVGEGPARSTYETTELISAEELHAEGVAMGHCVASYWKLCASGQTSIWSLSVADTSGRVERLLTLEVRNAARLIVQARGEANRLPTPEEYGIIAAWGNSGGPMLSRWLSDGPPDEIEPDD